MRQQSIDDRRSAYQSMADQGIRSLSGATTNDLAGAEQEDSKGNFWSTIRGRHGWNSIYRNERCRFCGK